MSTVPENSCFTSIFSRTLFRPGFDNERPLKMTLTPRERLIAELRRGQTVVLAGTGVSASLSGGESRSTWRGLLDDGVNHVSNMNADAGAILSLRLESACNAEDLTGIAKDIKRHLGSDFGRWIARSVGELPLENEELALALKALRSPVLTTNYDDLIERALGRPSVSWTNPSSMQKLLVNREEKVGHLHGIFSDSANVIFSDDDYHRVVRASAAQQIQTAAFTMQSFIFIGVGEGLGDPNFDPMVKALSTGFPDSTSAHFRLCKNSEVDPSSALKSVIDVGFGEEHEELAQFLIDLVRDADLDDLDLAAKSRSMIVESLRDNTTLWRDAQSLEEKGFHDLVVAPTFLPEPHNEYSNNVQTKTEKNRPQPLDIDALLADGGTVIIAGEENSGVSTALAYVLYRALDVCPGSHAILIDKPQVQGLNPVQRAISRTYRGWGAGATVAPTVHQRLVLGVDNLRLDGSQGFSRAASDITASEASIKIVGASQSDALEIAEKLKVTSSNVTIAYLGRFSLGEAVALAEKVAPERANDVARDAMTIIRDKNLPRTPFTLTLLVELVQSGATLKNEESEIAILNEYLDLLLGADFGRITDAQGLTVRQKRRVLEEIARKFVEQQEDAAPDSQVITWLEDLFEAVGWENFSVRDCLQELLSRRALYASGDGKLRFQRSAYLELMAGLAAKEDRRFRDLVFKAPMQLASIVRSYAAMARNDEEVVELVEREIDRISVQPPRGVIFKRVRRVEAHNDVFEDRSESEDNASDTTSSNNSIERQGMTGSYYDDSSDADSPAFLTSHLDDLSEARVAMLVVDLASRVLRDSDEVLNQTLKSRVLRKLLRAWVTFADLYELEIVSTPDLENVVRDFLREENGDEDVDDDEVEKVRAFLTRIIPVAITDSGIGYCLSSPSLVTRLKAEEFSDEEDGHEIAVIRALALLRSGGHQWVANLATLSDEAVRSFFCASFLASRARARYLSDQTLTDEHRKKIRAFLRRVIEARYSFRGVGHKNEVMNDFERNLRDDLLAKRVRPDLSIAM